MRPTRPRATATAAPTSASVTATRGTRRRGHLETIVDVPRLPPGGRRTRTETPLGPEMPTAFSLTSWTRRMGPCAAVMGSTFSCPSRPAAR